MMSVSVITPSYNQAEFIEDTIESVRRQTYGDVTHLVIDGESDDGTLNILRSCDDYDDLIWVSEPDHGQAHAINKGFDRADGDVIGWLNSDDPYVYRSVIANVVETFRHTDADILYGHAITIDRDNVLRRAHYLPRYDSDRLRRHCFIVQPSVFFRSHVLEDNQLNTDREYSMDYEFWLDLAEEYSFRRFDGIVAADRNHPDRKIIADASGSAADTAALRETKGISVDTSFRMMQLVDSAILRLRRIRALPLLAELFQAPDSKFAFELSKVPVAQTLRTHLIGGKKELRSCEVHCW